MKIRVRRLRDNAKLPDRAHCTDAGMDLFYAPDLSSRISKFITIKPGESVVLPTGLKIEVPPGFMLEVKNKGGVAAKQSLVVGSCVVDRGYDGEIFVNLHNIGNKEQTLSDGQKIAQGVFVKIETDVELVESDTIYDNKTDRGDGSLGSTGL